MLTLTVGQDHAPGAVLVEEAGGVISDGRGEPLDFGLGRTLGENLDRWTHEHGELEFSTQDVIRPLEKPIKETGHLRYVHTHSLSPSLSPWTVR